MKHIGIVGCSAEGAALCYRTICQEGSQFLSEHDHPEVSMHTFSLARYMEILNDQGWDFVGNLMAESANKLARAGAEFVVCPDNTIHQAFALAASLSTIPWLHIADGITQEALNRRYRRIAIFGTRWLMEGPVYRDSFAAVGIESHIPADADRERVNTIIFSELTKSQLKPASRRFFSRLIDRMRDQGCDAVVLGCTEIPLLVSQDDSSLPVFDSTRMLARAALKHAVECV